MARERQPHRQWDSAGKRVPVRSCVVCRRKAPQAELVRLTKLEGGVQLDPRRRAPGKGFYVCSSPQCRTEKALLRVSRTDATRLSLELENHYAHKGSYEQISATTRDAFIPSASGGQ